MQKSYKVYYAGVPETLKLIEAPDRKTAAMNFMIINKAANSIIVNEGWLRESIFSSDEIRNACHLSAEDDYPLLRPKSGDGKRRPFWKEYIHRLLTGGSRRI